MTTSTVSPRTTDASRELYTRARKVIPGGVNSPVRAMGSVGRDHPIFIASGHKSTLRDADGGLLVDWVQSWGALPLGHADSEVVAAINKTAQFGSSFGAPTRGEVELAELMVEAIPCADQVRFTSSGTEATMSALRLARAATGRDTVICCSGNYHGHADPFLATGGSGLATLSIPASPGVPATTAELTLQAPYGNLDAMREIAFESMGRGGPIAAIIVEPVAANMGVVNPPLEYLKGLRALCDEIGAVLIFDEVITGFRLAYGGAQERFGVTPDLACFGKIIGGGLPVGAFAGRRELMELVAPAGSMYQAGTLSGNPLAMAAGFAQLTALKERDAYTVLEERGARVEQVLQQAIESSNANAVVNRIGSLLTLFMLPSSTPEGEDDLTAAPRDFMEAQLLDTERFGRVHARALDYGHYLPASQFEALFISTTHTDEQIDDLGEAIADALLATGER